MHRFGYVYYDENVKHLSAVLYDMRRLPDSLAYSSREPIALGPKTGAGPYIH